MRGLLARIYIKIVVKKSRKIVYAEDHKLPEKICLKTLLPWAMSKLKTSLSIELCTRVPVLSISCLCQIKSWWPSAICLTTM